MLDNDEAGDGYYEEQRQHQSRAGPMPAFWDHWRWFGRFNIFDNGLVHCEDLRRDNPFVLLALCSACQLVAPPEAKKAPKPSTDRTESALCNLWMALVLFVAKKRECGWSHLGAHSGPPTLKTQEVSPPLLVCPLCLMKNAFNHNAGILFFRDLYLFQFVVTFISHLR